MAEPTKAVFLSYASQDAEAAKRICEALRAGGIEVWFDQSELRGGDPRLRAVYRHHLGHDPRTRGRLLPARVETRRRSHA
jgi:hypothetical protein